MQEKYVSIIMPMKNTERYVEECILSIINQSYPYWELIIVNDHSTDKSVDIIQKIIRGEHRISLINNDLHGIINALKKGYSASIYSLIHRMDADDIMPVNKLKLLIEHWREGAIVTGQVQYFSNEWLVGLGFQNYQRWINELMVQGNLWQDIYMECPIPSPAWLIHKEDFEKIGGFNSDLLPEDYDLCFRAYKHHIKTICISEVVHKWRDSQNRTSRKLPIYFPMNYYALKVHYFLEIDYNPQKRLLLWGAGKKGKRIAQLLLEKSTPHDWYTDNCKKQGVRIGNIELEKEFPININDYQLIIAVSSPEEKPSIQYILNENNLKKGEDYFWFC